MNQLQENTDAKSDKSVSGGRLAGNSLLNLMTSIIIIGLNIVFVPLMLHAFGSEFYGVLSATWMVLANFAWLDFGFSRASARYVAQELAIGRKRDAALWTITAVVSQTCLGILGTAIIWAIAPIVVDHIHVQPNSRDLVLLTIRLFAFSIPLDFANRSVSGVLQAGQRFDWVNGLSLFNTFSTYVAYGIGVFRGADFKTVICGLFVLKILNLCASYWGATHVLPDLKSRRVFTHIGEGYWKRAKTLIEYGLWIASAAIVGPLLLFLDQWMITFLIGVGQLPYYTIPSNLMWRLGIFPAALTSTLFPAFSSLSAQMEWSKIEDYFVRGHRYIFCVTAPIIFFLYAWGGEILRLWLGADVANNATIPLQMLSVGFLVGLVAPISGALLEAIGRPDILVKLYSAELPLNIAAVWLLTKYFGTPGAALSYTVRTVIETVALWVIVYRYVPYSAKRFLKSGIAGPLAAVIPLGVAGHFLKSATIASTWHMALTILVLSVYSWYCYKFVFDDKDRTFSVRFFHSKRRALMAKVFGRAVTATA